MLCKLCVSKPSSRVHYIRLLFLLALNSLILGACVPLPVPPALTAVPGVGKKTAQKLILDLRSRLELPDSELVPSSPIAEVRDALEGLGYQTSEIREAVSGLEESESVEAMLSTALRKLGRS